MKKLILLSCLVGFVLLGCKKEDNLTKTNNGGGTSITTPSTDTLSRFEIKPLNDFSYNITEIIFDNNQVAWLSTETGGIMKRSGTNWITYNTFNSGIMSNRCNSIASFNNLIYVCTNDGLSIFDGINWNNFNNINSGLLTNSLEKITININGEIWLASSDKLYNYNSGVITEYIFNTPPNYIYDIIVNNSGTIFLTSDLGLIKIENTQEEIFNGLISFPFEIDLDNSGNVWITGPGGLQKFEGSNFITYSPPSGIPFGSTFFAIDIDNDNNIWLGACPSNSKGALIKFDPSNQKWFYLISPSPVIDDAYCVYNIRIDHLGNKWVTRIGATLSMYNEGGINY